jgi:hypothetical protein
MSLQNPYYVGLQNVGSYQVSGIPFVTSSITAPISSSTPVQITFPSVTQRIIVENVGGEHLRVGFSSNGVKGSNYFLVHEHAGGTPSLFNYIDLRVKVSEIYILSHDGASTTAASISAELTNIDTSLLELSGPSGPNWSGSLGVG